MNVGLLDVHKIKLMSLKSLIRMQRSYKLVKNKTYCLHTFYFFCRLHTLHQIHSRECSERLSQTQKMRQVMSKRMVKVINIKHKLPSAASSYQIHKQLEALEHYPLYIHHDVA